MQGQYLAFIHLYTKVNRQPPAEVDMQRYFRVSPPSVHRVVVDLEAGGAIVRDARAGRAKGRSMRVAIDPKLLPGTRVIVSIIVGHVGAGDSVDDIAREYGITREDVLAAVSYAASVVGGEEFRAF